MKRNKFLYLVLASILLWSCTGKQSPSPISDIPSPDSSSDVVEVPFKDIAGVRIIPVTINGVKMDMIFDTGASTTCISLTEAIFLAKQGLLTEDDIIGSSKGQIANGDIVENTVIVLRELVIDEQIKFSNVEAVVVHSMEASLLLGNKDILDGVSSFTIDNDNQTINFIVK